MIECFNEDASGLLVVFVVGYDVFVEVNTVAAFYYDKSQREVELGRRKGFEVTVEIKI